MSDAMPHAVWSGEFVVWGVTLHCHVLNTGERVIDAEDVERLLGANTAGNCDEGDLVALARWQRGA